MEMTTIRRIIRISFASIHIKANIYTIRCSITMHTMHKSFRCLQSTEHGMPKKSFYSTGNICVLKSKPKNVLLLSSLQRNPRAKKSSVPNIDIYSTTFSSNDLKTIALPKQMLSRKRSEPDIHYGSKTLNELVCSIMKISNSILSHFNSRCSCGVLASFLWNRFDLIH